MLNKQYPQTNAMLDGVCDKDIIWKSLDWWMFLTVINCVVPYEFETDHKWRMFWTVVPHTCQLWKLKSRELFLSSFSVPSLNSISHTVESRATPSWSQLALFHLQLPMIPCGPRHIYDSGHTGGLLLELAE